jgi:hypothetical protein
MNEQQRTEQAARVGYRDAASLRQLLIATTSKDTSEAAMSYFQARFGDEGLLNALLPIALEGEDAGDAPWAAANVIAEFPANMLRKHEAALRLLGQEQWRYLKDPATRALAKIGCSPHS